MMSSHESSPGGSSRWKVATRIALAALITTAFSVLIAAPAGAAELIMFEQANCHWCKTWDAQIGPAYPNTEEARIAPLRKVDIHSALPADLAGIDPGRFTPTFVLVENGQEIGRIRGYPGEDFFWGLLDEMLKKLPDHGDNKAFNPSLKAI
ncbi:MAG: hypothetical protein R3D32_15435 [Nitratireductor sp.]